jgi:mono/diheme cytochrome c family protein
MTIGIAYPRSIATKKKRTAQRPQSSCKCEAGIKALAPPKMLERARVRHRGKLVTLAISAVAILASCDTGAAGPEGSGKAVRQTADTTPAKIISPRTLPGGITEQMVEQGRTIFDGHGGCFRCHGKDGAGTLFAPALNAGRHIHLQTGSYQEIVDLIRSGVPRPKRYMTAMPPLGGAPLIDDEVRVVAAYVFSIDRGP